MAVLRKIFGTSIAIAVALTVNGPSSAFAQEGGPAPAAPAQGGPGGGGGGQAGGRGGRGGGPRYTPAAGAKDLKAVLFNWAWYMGMLRSSEERDLLMSLEYQGKGTIQVDGQPCNVTKYRTSISYQTSGERIQYTGTRPNGQACSNVEVLSGAYAWNEDIPGAELVPGKGKATPMPAAVEERMIRLWASPQGAFKGAMAGISDPPEMAPRPQRVPADVAMAGKTSVAWEGNKPVVTFPIPGVPNATATATLDAKFMPERVVVKSGANTYEFTYSDYKDWNNPLNPAEAFYAGKMTERKNGAVVRDITTTLTETGQMYVVMPVPASVKAAMKPTNQPPNWTLNADAKATQTEAVATPRLANGKPDFTGTWGFAPLPVTGSGARRCGPTQGKGGGMNPEVGCQVAQDNFWVDYEWISPSRFGPSRPNYKPEYWDKIQELDQWTNKYDPVMTCQPLGLPRQGTPRRIIQTEKDIIFFYGQYSDYGGGNTEFRDIPTDGRARDEKKAIEATYYGYSIGKWEGDTLVIDSGSFVDSTWLGRGGLFHSDNMHIIEKLTRVGNELHYDMTIDDPDSFIEPWVMPTRTLRLNASADPVISERANCEVYETGKFSTQLRH
ncbi:MAG TPA: hypothetical protein VK724_28085 [Bryobacteraceae bacterium]|jgi:hypothetical protein|nr:hypothetical protein [Bryobacteraceae bacterium]